MVLYWSLCLAYRLGPYYNRNNSVDLHSVTTCIGPTCCSARRGLATNRMIDKLNGLNIWCLLLLALNICNKTPTFKKCFCMFKVTCPRLHKNNRSRINRKQNRHRDPLISIHVITNGGNIFTVSWISCHTLAVDTRVQYRNIPCYSSLYPTQ